MRMQEAMQEAMKSGLWFRRKGSTQWFKIQHHIFVFADGCSAGCDAVFQPSDILADWETKDPFTPKIVVIENCSWLMNANECMMPYCYEKDMPGDFKWKLLHGKKTRLTIEILS